MFFFVLKFSPISRHLKESMIGTGEPSPTVGSVGSRWFGFPDLQANPLRGKLSWSWVKAMQHWRQRRNFNNTLPSCICWHVVGHYHRVVLGCAWPTRRTMSLDVEKEDFICLGTIIVFVQLFGDFGDWGWNFIVGWRWCWCWCCCFCSCWEDVVLSRVPPINGAAASSIGSNWMWSRSWVYVLFHRNEP